MYCFVVVLELRWREAGFAPHVDEKCEGHSRLRARDLGVYDQNLECRMNCNSIYVRWRVEDVYCTQSLVKRLTSNRPPRLNHKIVGQRSWRIVQHMHAYVAYSTTIPSPPYCLRRIHVSHDAVEIATPFAAVIRCLISVHVG